MDELSLFDEGTAPRPVRTILYGPEFQQVTVPAPHSRAFNGADYVPPRDDNRLHAQINRIVALMRDEEWRTLADIAAITGDPEASISAQLRHLRKKRWGAHTVNRQHIAGGLYQYQLILACEWTGRTQP